MGLPDARRKAEDAKDTEWCTRVNQGRKMRRGRRSESCGRRGPEEVGGEPKRRGQLKGAKGNEPREKTPNAGGEA